MIFFSWYSLLCTITTRVSVHSPPSPTLLYLNVKFCKIQCQRSGKAADQAGQRAGFLLIELMVALAMFVMISSVWLRMAGDICGCAMSIKHHVQDVSMIHAWMAGKSVQDPRFIHKSKSLKTYRAAIGLLSTPASQAVLKKLHTHTLVVKNHKKEVRSLVVHVAGYEKSGFYTR